MIWLPYCHHEYSSNTTRHGKAAIFITDVDGDVLARVRVGARVCSRAAGEIDAIQRAKEKCAVDRQSRDFVIVQAPPLRHMHGIFSPTQLLPQEHPSSCLGIILSNTSTILKPVAQVVLSACIPLCRCKSPPSHSLGIVLSNTNTYIVAPSNHKLPEAAARRSALPRKRKPSPDIFSNTSALDETAAESSLAVRAAQRRPATGILKRSLPILRHVRSADKQQAGQEGVRDACCSSAACSQLSAASLYRCSPYKHWPFSNRVSAAFFETRKWRREITQHA
jgi:hypothetical protein